MKPNPPHSHSGRRSLATRRPWNGSGNAKQPLVAVLHFDGIARKLRFTGAY